METVPMWYCSELRRRFINRIGGRIANEILMFLRAERKKGREVSLYEPIGTDKEGNVISLVDIIEAESRDVAEKISVDQDIRRMYGAFEDSLSDREKQVVALRYGLFGGKEHTQREVAAVLGISRSYVSRIEKNAVEKLRRCFQSAGTS